MPQEIHCCYANPLLLWYWVISNFLFGWNSDLNISKKPYFTRSRSNTSTNRKDKVICNNSLQLKAVKFSFFISSSILHVGRDPGPASDKHGILRKSWQSITFYTDKLQKYCWTYHLLLSLVIAIIYCERGVFQFINRLYEIYCGMGVLPI